jgi:hypothetical protein
VQQRADDQHARAVGEHVQQPRERVRLVARKRRRRDRSLIEAGHLPRIPPIDGVESSNRAQSIKISMYIDAKIAIGG